MKFFFGTPQKILTWVVIGVIVWSACNLETLEIVLGHMINITINKILPLVVLVGLLVYVFKRLTK